MLNPVAPDYSNPIKTIKVNIGIEENPKLVIIGDCWDEYTIMKIISLLMEY